MNKVSDSGFVRIHYGPAHFYMRQGVWIVIQWHYGKNATDDELLHAAGRTWREAWLALCRK